MISAQTESDGHRLQAVVCVIVPTPPLSTRRKLLPKPRRSPRVMGKAVIAAVERSLT